MYAAMRARRRYAAVTTVVVILVVGPIMAAIVRGILFGVFTRARRAGDVQAGARGRASTPASSLARRSCSSAPLNYFAAVDGSATNLAVLLPMLDEQSFLGRLLGMIDLFWIW